MISYRHPPVVRPILPLPTAARTKPAVAHPTPADATVTRLLAQLAPITLGEMDGVALQDRIDTKYVFRVEHFASALAALGSEYQILEIERQRVHRYQTLYFDTPDFALFRQHHNGRRNRYKVRSRCYVDTALSCLEVKRKSKLDRTLKQRLRTPEFLRACTPEARRFLDQLLPLDAQLLQPTLANDFRRITLVNQDHAERLTIDLELRFAAGDNRILLPGIVVAEVKQGQHGDASPFMRLMRAAQIRPSGFSKYCIGVSLLYPAQKHNNFNAQLRSLRRLSQGGADGYR